MRYIPYTIATLVITLSIWIGCGMRNKAETPLPAPKGALFSVTDTPKIKELPKSVFVEKPLVLPTVKPLDYQNIDSLRKQNYALVNNVLYIMGRNRTTREQKDSLVALIKGVQDTLNIANRRANQYYAAAKKANYYENQNKTISSSINWQFYIAFAITLTILLIHTFLLRRINKSYQL